MSFQELPTVEQGSVLIVGAGIAGMDAAMHLAELGFSVYLLDAAPGIGGSMHLLDHTFPTDSCGLCLMLPRQPAYCPSFECQDHELIHLLPYAEVVAVEKVDWETGKSGKETQSTNLPTTNLPTYQLTIRHKARYVDPDLCTGCGECAALCPEARPHDHEGWQAPVKAIYRPAGLRAVPDGWLIDMDYCTRCGACVKACPVGAIDLDMEARTERLEVGAVLLTPGFAPFEARIKGEYGYGVYDNVLSALEFERLVSYAGSTVAHLQRPSDGGRPRKVAFVHCVGSRDNLCGAGYCSSVCCMYTAKQVALAKRLDPELEVTVFFIDLRAMGKDFEAYLDGVQALPGVTYRRAMPSSVHQMQRSRNLLISYIGEDTRLHEEEFDLVVLAIGLAPPAGMQELARQLGLKLNDYGFAATDGYHPTQTGQPGLFVAGAFREPKDIPDTVAEAVGAAAQVAAYLGAAAAEKQQLSGAELRDIADEEPRVGVFVCHCGGELDPLDPAALAAQARTLAGVVVAQALPLACSAEGQAAMRAAIEQEQLNRVVIAGCSHREYRAEFEALMGQVGLDGRLLARVNLRDQVVRAQGGNGAGGRAKALSLVSMAVTGLRSLTGVNTFSVAQQQPATRRALVLGGGAAGLTAALELAALGIPVELVEREAEVGGQWRHIRYQPDGSDPQGALRDLVARVGAEERIRLRLETELQGLEGRPGRYRAVLLGPEGEERVEVGVVIVATGGGPAATEEYLYGTDPRVVTQRELEQQLAEGTLARVGSVVMVQCVGSREPGRPYCSRVCCTQAVKNALELKAQRPEVEVYVLYREMRTFGFREAYYQAAREAGVVFVRYELGGKPEVEAEAGGLRVRLDEPVTGLPLELEADLVVLSVGIEPHEEQGLARMLGLELDEAGFFQEEQAKMKPLDLGGDGFYVAGLAHSPRFLEEAIVEGQGAALRAAVFLASWGGQELTGVWVNERLCSFCGLCVDACPFGARVLDYDRRVAQVDDVVCRGCGVCAMVCPNKATLQKAFDHRQLLAVIDTALL